jgi:hypothetical protein
VASKRAQHVVDYDKIHAFSAKTQKDDGHWAVPVILFIPLFDVSPSGP